MNSINVLAISVTVLLMVSVSGIWADTLSGRACEGNTLNIQCENGLINVIKANYGRLSKTICNADGRHPIRNFCLWSPTLDIVKAKCSNQKACSIQATNGVFGDSCEGTYKYLDVEYECIQPKSMSAEVCEGNNMNIKCEEGLINVIGANYGRLSRDTCNSDGRRPVLTVSCVSKTSFDIVTAKCTNQKTCSIPATNGVFGDPCVGTYKYLNVKYQCIPTRQTVACEGSNLEIKCKRGEQIFVVGANYGRTSQAVCNNGGSAPIRTNNCSSQNSKSIVSNGCSGKQQCKISATNAVFGDPCVNTYKYLEIEYICTKRWAMA